jgi:hypothetical protein
METIILSLFMVMFFVFLAFRRQTKTKKNLSDTSKLINSSNLYDRTVIKKVVAEKLTDFSGGTFGI